MILKKFIFYSLLIHLLTISSLSILSFTKAENGMQLRLISIDEVQLADLDQKESAKSPGFVEPQLGPLSNTPGEMVKQYTLPDISSVPPELLKDNSPPLSVQGHFPENSPYATTIMPGAGLAFGGRRENLWEGPPNQETGFTEDNIIIPYDQDRQSYEYLRKLKEKIEEAWQYPLDAAIQGLAGDLYVSITIVKNGTLSKIEIVRSSGNKSLDDEVIRTIQQMFPYEPLPGLWKKDSITIAGHFVYTRSGISIR